VCKDVEAPFLPLPYAMVQAAALGWGLISSGDKNVTHCGDDDDDGVDCSV
jgi:hypothetical protein